MLLNMHKIYLHITYTSHAENPSDKDLNFSGTFLQTVKRPPIKANSLYDITNNMAIILIHIVVVRYDLVFCAYLKCMQYFYKVHL